MITGPLEIQVLSPRKALVQTKAKYISIPSEMGEIGILSGHAPLVCKLSSGILSYQKGDKFDKIAVHWGFVEIRENKVVVLADLAESSDEISAERAEKTIHKAEEELKGFFEGEEGELRRKKLYNKIVKAKTRLRVISES